MGLLALLLAVLGQTATQAAPVVERISFAARADGLGYVVRIHTTERLAAFSQPRLSSDGRLEVVLFNTAPAAALYREAPAGPVQAYSVEARAGHLHLLFQLDARYAVEASAYRDRDSDDLLLGLTSRGAPSPPVPVRPVATHTPPLDPRDARARWQLDTIVIDAGHGGHDSGAVGVGGLREKDVVLPVARRVGQALEVEAGLRVVYTRTDDTFISLRQRGKIANGAGGKLFVSIHANAARNRQAAGTETYFLGLHKSDAARAVMERENSVIRYERDPSIYHGLDQQQLIQQTLAQSAYMRQSEHLSDLIQQEFTHALGRRDRGVKQAGFYVLWSASMPSILVELGFVTNPAEAAYLGSEAGQAALADAIVRAIHRFKQEYEKGLAVGY